MANGIIRTEIIIQKPAGTPCGRVTYMKYWRDRKYYRFFTTTRKLTDDRSKPVGDANNMI